MFGIAPSIAFPVLQIPCKAASPHLELAARLAGTPALTSASEGKMRGSIRQ
jgi:hypothetical protein